MDDSIGPFIAGVRTAAYGWTTAGFWALALVSVALVALLWRRRGRVLAAVAMVVMVAGAWVALFDWPVSFSYGEQSKVYCGAQPGGPLSDALMRGMAGDKDLRPIQLACRRAARQRAVASFVVIPVAAAALLGLNRVILRRTTSVAD